MQQRCFTAAQEEIAPKFLLYLALWVDPTILWASPTFIAPVVVVADVASAEI